MKNTYFESMLSVACVDKAMICFIEAIFKSLCCQKNQVLMLNREMCSNKYSLC